MRHELAELPQAQQGAAREELDTLDWQSVRGVLAPVHRFLRRWPKRTVILVAVVTAVVLAVAGGSYALFFGGAPTQSSSNDINLDKGLVGWWKFDGNAKDSTPYAHDGSLVNGATVNAADRENAPNSALNVSRASSQYVNVGTYSSLTPSSISISAWVYAKTLDNWDGIFSNFSTWGYGFGLQIGSTQNIAATVSGTYLKTSWVPSVNTWYHIVATHDSSTNLNVLYVNGASQTTLTQAVTYQSSASTQIGVFYTSPSLFFNGYLDDVRVYNRALSANEVKALYNTYGGGGIPISFAPPSAAGGLVGWWKFDGNAKDSTPYGHDGTTSNVSLTTDREGASNSAYSFSGTSSSYVSVANSAIFTFGTGNSFSVSAWIKPTSPMSSYEAVIYKGGQDSNVAGYQLFTGGTNTIYLRLTWPGGPQYGVAAQKSGLTLNDGKWHLVTGVVDRTANTATVYVDGVAGSPAGISSVGNTSSSQNLLIGNGGAGYFNGSIDDVRIYSEALSAANVASLAQSYNSQIKISDLSKGLVGDWPMNGNATDNTPYSDNGTVSGATLTTDRKGRTNSAYTFNGTTNTISFGAPSRLSLAGPLTESAWINLSSVGSVEVPIGAVAQYNLQVSASGTGSVKLADGSGHGCQTSPGIIASGSWYHIVGVLNATSGSTVTTSNCLIYVNGVQQSVSIVGSPWSPSTLSSFNIGSWGSTYYVNGAIDDVEVWNRALSAAEISLLYDIYR